MTDIWLAQANCADMDLDLFFSSNRQDKKIAIKACLTCPVKAECIRDVEYQHAVNGVDLTRGIRGGLLKSQLRKLIKLNVFYRDEFILKMWSENRRKYFG